MSNLDDHADVIGIPSLTSPSGEAGPGLATGAPDSGDAMKTHATTPSAPYQGSNWKRSRTILARSFYNQLRSQGLSPNQIIELSSELLGLVSGDLPGEAH